MDVILKQDVERLGAKNDIVTVKTGYARNYLIPQGFAIAATDSARKVVAETIRQQSHKALKALEDAKAVAEKMAGVSVKIGAKAGEAARFSVPSTTSRWPRPSPLPVTRWSARTSTWARTPSATWAATPPR